MLTNYIKIALRNILKNRLYAAINIIGLALGLTIYLFGGILADYERNHDISFKNHERIYTVGSVMSPQADIGVKELDNTFNAIGPLIATNMADDVEKMARTVVRNFLLSMDDRAFYEDIRFADKELLEIFDFQYIQGGPDALYDPRGIVLSRTQAEKFFGRTDVLGETIMLNNEHDLRVQAVVEDMPKNSHFVSSFIVDSPMTLIAPVEALNRITGWDLAGNWDNINSGNQVYVMTYAPMNVEELSQKFDAVFQANVQPEMQERFINSVKARELKSTHNALWEMVGMPVIESIQILGFLVLVIAIVNYTNLATAQSMGRTREVGLRKTLGARKKELLAQFLTESLVITGIAMVLALVFLEAIVPQFNLAANKVLSIQYASLMPWLVITALLVGIAAGSYPAVMISRTNPIEALKDMAQKGGKGSFFRSLMIGVQFMLSIFMLAVVMIVFFQNKKVQEASNIFPKDEVLIVHRTGVDEIRKNEDVLRRELMAIDAVSNVSFSSQVPFNQSNSFFTVTKERGGEEEGIKVNRITMDHAYIDTFNIPLLAGRKFDANNGADQRLSIDDRTMNVIVNETAVRMFGIANPVEAIGQSVWGGTDGDRAPMEYKIIGVVEDQNIQGLHNSIKPWLFEDDIDVHNFGAIRIKAGSSAATVEEIERTWKRVIPDFPMEHEFMDGYFENAYAIYKNMNLVLAGFAAFALVLALIGLFGLAAFMARGRTREIGIRKVMGASLNQIIRLLIWQFSKPVMWAIVVALPLSYLASEMYLGFFAERIGLQIPIILLAGVLAVILAWGIIAIHAVAVARANPVRALRYE